MATVFLRALVVGASSGIGREVARELARSGASVALVARRESELSELADEIGSDKTFVYPHDVTDFDAVPHLFQSICRDLGGLDVFVYAAGVMPRIGGDEYDFAKDRAMIDVNVLGAIAWCNEAAQRFAASGSGALVGIGSVAGDRGRAPQPVYGASKAFLETYLESLRNRIGSKGVHVVTIKPGPVRTPMTEGLHMPMMIDASDAARQIVGAAKRGQRVAYVPGKWKLVMGILRAIPSPIFQKLKI